MGRERGGGSASPIPLCPWPRTSLPGGAPPRKGVSSHGQRGLAHGEERGPEATSLFHTLPRRLGFPFAKASGDGGPEGRRKGEEGAWGCGAGP